MNSFKKLLLILIVLGFVFRADAYDKKSLVERFTNWGCGPCAALNNAWYNAVTAEMLNSGTISHIIYNVDWPSDNDPMHILNAVDNNMRRGYYGVNAVPWIDINGNEVSTSQSAFENAVTNGNAEFAPFNIFLTPEKFSNNVINVHVKIVRDPADNTTFTNTKLRVALTEKSVDFGFPSPNGETIFFSVCRKMLPDGNGSSFDIPEPGDSTELDLLYIPSEDFIQSVNLDSIRVVAFIQNDDTKEVYQSTMTDIETSNKVNAAFTVDETLGASPLTVNFTDYSTATDTTNIISWQWDFNNDGVIDSDVPNPEWTFINNQSYDVSLTVSDGVDSYTRTMNGYVTVLGATSSILVVNGIEYATYGAEMENFYNSSACFGNHEVDVWDLFGDQGFDYSANPDIKQIDLYNRDIPNSILNLYSKVIWIGNSYGGDEVFYDPAQVLNYIQQGGNFLLATREGAEFFSTELKDYCGITSMSGLLDVTQLIALDDSLVNMPAGSGHSRVQFALLDAGSKAIPIFDDNTSTNWIAGFRIQKDNNGAFLYIAGRPYRYDNSASFKNYNYIIDNWMNFIPVNVEDETGGSKVTDFQLYQNYPNPFNPSTTIQYSVINKQFVTLKVFDVLGNEIATLVNEEKSAGTYSINFNASNLPSGIYFYKLQAGSFTSSKKMLLLK